MAPTPSLVVAPGKFINTTPSEMRHRVTRFGLLLHAARRVLSGVKAAGMEPWGDPPWIRRTIRASLRWRMVMVPWLAADWSRPSGEKLNVVLVLLYPEPM